MPSSATAGPAFRTMQARSEVPRTAEHVHDSDSDGNNSNSDKKNNNNNRNHNNNNYYNSLILNTVAITIILK